MKQNNYYSYSEVMLSQSWAPLRETIDFFLRTVMHIINLFYLFFSVTVLSYISLLL